MYKIFYKPDDGAAADFIPFWHDGKFRLFYLKDWRDIENHGEGVAWFQLSTDDFINFEELGESLQRGTPEEQDLYVFTGSVIKLKADNKFYIFYTGHNPRFAPLDKPVEGIMRAVSDDLIKWDKLSEDTFYADASKYETQDFRDSFVFYDENKQKYCMLLVSRKKDSGHHSGFTALYTSSDLREWTDEGDFWSPCLYHTHECPDLFKMGDWWYLIYSEYSDKSMTRYVMSKNQYGPWEIPSDDSFDGRAYYAAKSYSDESEKRYLFGWIPTKTGNNDYNGWMWGGNLAVHEIFQRENGTLGCRLPLSIDKQWKIKSNSDKKITVSNHYGKASELLFGETENTFRVDMRLSFTEGTKQFGIAFCQDFEENNGYKYAFLPYQNTVRFDCEKNCVNTKDVTRQIDLSGGNPVDITLIADNDICVMYINNDIALSSRMYNQGGRDISFFAIGGEAFAENIKLYDINIV